jgi:Cof subfamily protein (haloacid dehalogenase superfamily)
MFNVQCLILNSQFSMSTIKLIAFDLDGTLTNDDKIITPRTMEALRTVQKHGVRLCLSSGRPPYGMRPLAREIGGEVLLLCYNGGYIEIPAVDGKGAPEVLVEKTLPEEVLPKLKAFQDESGFTLMTYYEDTIYTEHPDSPYVAVSARNNKMKVRGIKDFVADTPRPLHKCLMVGAPEARLALEEQMQASLKNMYICHSTPYFIECLPLGIDKGKALEELAARLGIPMQDVMAFGDSNNDVGMLEKAGVGIAMGNAEENVKAVADYTTASNNDDGIALSLRTFFPALF